MTITPLPPAPNRTDPATFSDRADNFVAALSNLVTEINAIPGVDASAVQITGGTINGTSIGATTASSIRGTTLTATGDVTIPDRIIHAGDTNTQIRFPAADTVTVETNGAERLRVDSSGTLQSPGGSAFVGTVATGSTLGAIIQGGSNANGEFVRFADGTQICTITGVTMTFSSAGNVDYVWTYPASFSSLPASYGTWRNAVGASPAASDLGPVSVTSNSSTSGNFRILRISGTTDFVSGDTISNVVLTAIGRWF